jgi:hypothetical protein
MGQTADTRTGTSSFQVDGTYTYVGDETFPVMGHEVGAKHFHDARNVSGQQTGTNTADWYFSLEDGSLQRFSRQVDIDYNSIVGTAHYHETVDLTLAARPGATDAGSD